MERVILTVYSNDFFCVERLAVEISLATDEEKLCDESRMLKKFRYPCKSCDYSNPCEANMADNGLSISFEETCGL